MTETLQYQKPFVIEGLTNKELADKYDACWLEYATEQKPETLRMCRILDAEVEFRQATGSWKPNSPVPDPA